jgi:hypothetical protein
VAHSFGSLSLFLHSSSESEKVFEGLNIHGELLEALQENIARRLTPKAMKIRADVEVKCFSYEGIDAIKAALKAGEALSTETVPIKIRLVAPPLYVITTNSTDKTGGVELMEKALVVIDEKITEMGGSMSVKMKVSSGSSFAGPAPHILTLVLSAPCSPRPSRRPRTSSLRPSWPRSSARTPRSPVTRTARTRRSKEREAASQCLHQTASNRMPHSGPIKAILSLSCAADGVVSMR